MIQTDRSGKGQSDESIGQASTEKLPFGEKVAFGLGDVANRYGENGINDVATPVYNTIFKLPPDTIGWVLGLMRLWDAITDPIMGYVSDNRKGKWGRRKPFIFIGAILMAIAYPLIWMASPDWTNHAKTLYLFCFAIIFFTTYTIYSVPFRALATEMTPDYTERTTIRLYSAFFGQTILLFIPWLFPLSQMERIQIGGFGVPFTDVSVPILAAFKLPWADPVTGIRLLMGLAGISILVTGIICAIFPKERYQKIAANQDRVSFGSSFISLVADRPFLMLHGIGICLLSSILLVGSLGLYVNMYYIWQGDTATGSSYQAIVQNILQVLGYIMLFVISTFLAKMEKKVLLSLSLGLALVGSLARWFTYNQDVPQLVFLDPFFFAPAYTTFWAIFLSMLSDYCDYDEHKNGKRREGVFSAISGWMIKAGASVALIVAGVVLQQTGFDAEIEGKQTQATLTNMRIALVLLPVLCLAFSLLLSIKYPLTKKRMETIRAELEERRGIV